MFKNLIDITDTQIAFAREAMLTIQRAKITGEIAEKTANILMAGQMVMMQAGISNSQILKEVEKDEVPKGR